jgi:hypothetical protein
MFNLRKILVRVAVVIMMASILGYIFWPESNIQEQVTNTTFIGTDTTIVPVVDAPCLVLYQKDTSTTVLKDTACIATYVNKYNNLQYKSLNIVCRSSGDGRSLNRNALSEKRMEALQFNLMKLGVKFEHIKATSIGDKSPYPGVDPQSEDGKILNRSCEITGNN